MELSKGCDIALTAAANSIFKFPSVKSKEKTT
jgi:hypothetical protein